VDVVGEGFDLAVRIGALTDSSLRARRLGSTRQVVCASPAYLERRGRPSTPADLADHECLLYAGQQPGPSWRFTGGETIAVRGRLRADSGDVLRDFAVAGAGLAWLPDFYAAGELADGRLVAVLTEHEAEPAGIWVVYPPGRGLSAKVRIAIDCLVAAFDAV
jgi:DNA-binding transcriptional LysR family regulator